MLMERPKKFNFKEFLMGLGIGVLALIISYFVLNWYLQSVNAHVEGTLDIELSLARGRIILFWIGAVLSIVYGVAKISRKKWGAVIKYIFLIFSLMFYFNSITIENESLELQHEYEVKQSAGEVIEKEVEEKLLYQDVYYKLSKAIRDNFIITTLLWISLTDVVIDLVIEKEENK